MFGIYIHIYIYTYRCLYFWCIFMIYVLFKFGLNLLNFFLLFEVVRICYFSIWRLFLIHRDYIRIGVSIHFIFYFLFHHYLVKLAIDRLIIPRHITPKFLTTFFIIQGKVITLNNNSLQFN